jgi:chromosome segregation ATPase
MGEGERMNEEDVIAPVTEADTEEPQEQIVVSIGDEPAKDQEDNEPAPVWVKKVRQRNRELEKELRETKKQLQTVTAPKEPEVGVKPTLEKFDYDTEKYEQALTTWYDRKKQADERAAKAREEAQKAEQDWNSRLESYQEAKASFKADDYDEAEAVTLELLDQTQQGIIVHGANDPALLVYALGKNEDKAKELGAIKDPVKFAFAIAKLEAQLKVSTKKPATQPESRISGNSRPSGTVDSTLERLREEANKTGDYSKVVEYKRKKK